VSELERNLRALAGELDYPATPDLGAMVAARLEGRQPDRRGRALLPRARFARALALALLLVALAAGAALAASPSLRDELLELLGLRGATVERVSRPPPAERAQPELGRRTTLAEAQRQARFRVLLHRRPDQVFFSDRAAGGLVTLGFRPRHGEERLPGTRLGVIVGEFRGDLEPGLVSKAAGPGTRVESLRIDGQPAIWLSGGAHAFFYVSPDGDTREAPARLASNTLLVERGRLLVRIEGKIARRRAIAIASSLR
jgi:hypothetical protein